MFLQKLIDKIKAIFGIAENYLETHIDTAIDITSWLKSFLTNPVVIAAADLIMPATTFTALDNEAERILQGAINDMKIFKDVDAAATWQEKYAIFLADLKADGITLFDVHSKLGKLASRITAHLDNLAKPEAFYDYAVQAKYTADYAKAV